MTDENRSLSAVLEATTRAVNESKANGGQPVVENGTGNIARYAEALVERISTAGGYCRKHGEYLESISLAFADQLAGMTANFSDKILEAERRKTAALERILGKTDAPQQ